jgi:hypothetical protein
MSSSSTYSNSTALGYNAQVTASNQIQLGDANITDIKTSGKITAKEVATTRTFIIGESYGGGVIFYVTPDEKHGLVAATQDQSNTSSWRNAQNNISTHANHNADGKNFTDWRLPTKYELDLLYSAKSSIGDFPGNDYWSSTEADIYSAWARNFNTGTVVSPDKSSHPASVRAVRAF